MKIRNGFISNSSSTSFIIAYKNASKSSGLCKRINLEDFIEYAEAADNNCGNTGIRCPSTKEGVVTSFSHWVSYSFLNKDEKEKNLKILEEMKSMDEDTWNFIRFDLSYHDRIARTILSIMVEDGDARILHKDSC